MRGKRAFVLVMLLGLALCTVPAQASTVTMNQSHTFQITVTGLTFAGDGGSIAFASGLANGTTVSDPYNWAMDANLAVVPDGNWLVTTSAGQTYDHANLTYSMTQNIVGNSPGAFGDLSQLAQNIFYLNFLAAADTASVTITPMVSGGTFGVSGQAGEPHFYQLNTYSDFTASLYAGLPTDPDPSVQSLLFSEMNGGKFADFSGAVPGLLGITLNLTGLTLGDPVYLDLGLTTTVDGLSQVPLPPSVLLFGSGLGLLLWGRRRSTRPS